MNWPAEKHPTFDDKRIIPNLIQISNKHSFPLNQKGSLNWKSGSDTGIPQHFLHFLTVHLINGRPEPFPSLELHHHIQYTILIQINEISNGIGAREWIAMSQRPIQIRLEPGMLRV
jgi:hypothetical protein